METKNNNISSTTHSKATSKYKRSLEEGTYLHKEYSTYFTQEELDKIESRRNSGFEPVVLAEASRYCAKFFSIFTNAVEKLEQSLETKTTIYKKGYSFESPHGIHTIFFVSSEYANFIRSEIMFKCFTMAKNHLLSDELKLAIINYDLSIDYKFYSESAIEMERLKKNNPEAAEKLFKPLKKLDTKKETEIIVNRYKNTQTNEQNIIKEDGKFICVSWKNSVKARNFTKKPTVQRQATPKQDIPQQEIPQQSQIIEQQPIKEEVIKEQTQILEHYSIKKEPKVSQANNSQSQTKKATRKRVNKPLTEEQKEKRREYNRQYREKNKEKLSEKNRKYREENKERIAETSHARYERKKLETAEMLAKMTPEELENYNKEKQARIKERNRKQYEAKKKKIAELKNSMTAEEWEEYKKEQREHKAAYQRERRANRTPEQIEKERQQNKEAKQRFDEKQKAKQQEKQA